MNIAATVAQALLSSRADAPIAADKSGRIIFWNAGAERMFGHSAASALGASLDIIIPERLRQRHWDGYRRVMNSGASRYGEEAVLAVPGLRKDGTRISLEFTIAFLRDEKGQVIGLAALLRDVTTRFEEIRTLKSRIAEQARAQKPGAVTSNY